jgi:RimJ/RimL family protein N-acetyltransferase
MQAVRNCLKRLAHLFLTGYEAYFIYGSRGFRASPPVAPYVFAEVGDATLETAAGEIRASRIYAGEGAQGFGLFDGGRPVCVAWFWYGDRYRTRNFWPLAPDEAKLVHIVSSPDMRGRGLAPMLLELCVDAMANKGFHRLYARIWFSNTPSVRAFRKAGWRRVALAFTGRLRGFDREFRTTLRLGWTSAADGHAGCRRLSEAQREKAEQTA